MPKKVSESSDKMPERASQEKGLARRLRELRGGSTQREFATRVDITQPQLARYEGGGVTPGRDVLAKISQACGVSVDWLLTGEPAQRAGGSPEAPTEFVAVVRALLSGSPLEAVGAQVRHPPQRKRGGQQADDDRSRDVLDTVRAMVGVAVVIQRALPSEIADKLNHELTRLARRYLADTV
jgi:transcriptional regulator with XRE-family HTH domain